MGFASFVTFSIISGPLKTQECFLSMCGDIVSNLFRGTFKITYGRGIEGYKRRDGLDSQFYRLCLCIRGPKSRNVFPYWELLSII